MKAKARRRWSKSRPRSERVPTRILNGSIPSRAFLCRYVYTAVYSRNAQIHYYLCTVRVHHRRILLGPFRLYRYENRHIRERRTLNASSKSLNSGLTVAFRSGAVMGLVVVGLGLLDISIWYFFLNAILPDARIKSTPLPRRCLRSAWALRPGAVRACRRRYIHEGRGRRRGFSRQG